MTATQAPLVILPHNWENSVKRTLSYRTDILRHRDGSEQRRQLRGNPIVLRTYSLTVTERNESSELLRVLWKTSNLRIAFPRWEDVLPLGVPALTGDTTLTLQQAVGSRTYGTDALLWIEGGIFERLTLVDVTADTISLALPLENDWPIGSAFVPLMTGYVQSPVSGDDSGHLQQTLEITIQEEDDIAGVTDVEQEVAMVPVSLTVYPHAPDAENIIACGDVQGLVAEVRDASGAIIPDADVSWDTLDPSISVYPSGMTNVANVKNNRSAPDPSGLPVSVSLTASAGTLTYTLFIDVE